MIDLIGTILANTVLISTILGAVVGASIIFIIIAIRDWRKKSLDIKIEEKILAIKKELLNELRQNIKEIQETTTIVGITQEQTLKDAKEIRIYSKQVKEMINTIREKENLINSEEAAHTLRKEITSTFKPEIENTLPQPAPLIKSTAKEEKYFGYQIWLSESPEITYRSKRYRVL